MKTALIRAKRCPSDHHKDLAASAGPIRGRGLRVPLPGPSMKARRDGCRQRTQGRPSIGSRPGCMISESADERVRRRCRRARSLRHDLAQITTVPAPPSPKETAAKLWMSTAKINWRPGGAFAISRTAICSDPAMKRPGTFEQTSGLNLQLAPSDEP